MPDCDHIFIGGISRSGTDLLRNALNAADDIAICGETHYLGSPRLPVLAWQWLTNAQPTADTAPGAWEAAPPGSRRHLARVGDLTTDAGVRQVVDYLYDRLDKRERAMWRRLVEAVPREAFLRRLLATDRSPRAFFELVLSLNAAGRPVRGEKTPAHIHYVPTLLDWFPRGRFVHMLRDPRAVFLSQKTKKSTSPYVSPYHRALRSTGPGYELYMSLGVILHWLRVTQLHAHYQRCYPGRYYALRFEDLVTNPEPELRKLCDFLDLEFSDQLLQRRVVNSSFAARGVQAAGFDRSVAERWRTALHPNTRRWITAACHSQMQALGYSP
jgi:hypothetical protein